MECDSHPTETRLWVYRLSSHVICQRNMSQEMPFEIDASSRRFCTQQSKITYAVSILVRLAREVF